MAGPRLQAIFQKMIDGDDALLSLAQRRFGEAGLGAEFYPESPEHLRHLLSFRPPSSASYTVHLPRNINLLDRECRERILAYAADLDGQAAELVVHDQVEAENNLREYVTALKQLDAQMRSQGSGPLVLLEYASGLEPKTYLTLLKAVHDCPRISACLDIGHLAIAHCHRALKREHPTLDLWQLKSDLPRLRTHLASVEDVCRTALPAVLKLTASLSRLGKPVHFHLHDAHPLSTLSSYGVSDHLSFFQEITIPFSYRGSYVLPMIFGPVGLRRVVAAARKTLPDKLLTFTLEIHPTKGRQPLKEEALLFRHWRDVTNAEQMQHWIEVLLQNHRLLQEACS